ncbi:MAG: ABC transporter ATP-binding protein [Bacillota bacterium]|nr:ABC transporter ATP-binding protein [Bacillota bacterium]
MLELQDVVFKYKDATALDGISVKIEKGEAVALIGCNGSGKSSFLKIINGILFPQSGKFLFNGQEITEKKMGDSKFSKLFHKKIGFVFQNSEAQLFCPLVYEEIAFGPMQMGLDDVEVNRRVNDCLKLLQIEHLKHRAPYNLSGGEKKRVAIACVLSMNPDILVLDEPMNALDPKTKRFLRDLLIKLNAAGKTIICSTHDFEYVNGVFNRAIVFADNHKIIRDDNYDAVIQDDEFLEKYNIK